MRTSSRRFLPFLPIQQEHSQCLSRLTIWEAAQIEVLIRQEEDMKGRRFITKFQDYKTIPTTWQGSAIKLSGERFCKMPRRAFKTLKHNSGCDTWLSSIRSNMLRRLITTTYNVTNVSKYGKILKESDSYLRNLVSWLIFLGFIRRYSFIFKF